MDLVGVARVMAAAEAPAKPLMLAGVAIGFELADRQDSGGNAQCAVCGSVEGVQRYAVTVDEVPLRLAPLLCGEHGGRFLIRAGSVLATLEKPIEDVLQNWAVGKAR